MGIQATAEYTQALAVEATLANQALGTRRGTRLGKLVNRIVDTRTEEQKMSDLAIVTQQSAIQQTDYYKNATLKEIKGIAATAYGGLKVQMTDQQLGAIAVIGKLLGLNVSPGTGELYFCSAEKTSFITIGYKGLARLLKSTHHVYIKDPQPFTPEMIAQHCLDTDIFIGAYSLVYDLDVARECKELGIPYEPKTGIATAEISETPPKHRTVLWRAGIRSFRDAANSFGIFNRPMVVDNFVFDGAGKFMPIDPSFSPPLPVGNDDDEFVEGEAPNTVFVMTANPLAKVATVEAVATVEVAPEPQPDPVVEAAPVVPQGDVRSLDKLKADLLAKADELQLNPPATTQEMQTFNSRFLTRAVLGSKALSNDDAETCRSAFVKFVFGDDLEKLEGKQVRALRAWVYDTNAHTCAAEIQGAWAALQAVAAVTA